MTLTFTPSPAPDPDKAVWRGEAALRWEECEILRKFNEDHRMFQLWLGQIPMGYVSNDGWGPHKGQWRASNEIEIGAVRWCNTEHEAKELWVEHVVRLIQGDEGTSLIFSAQRKPEDGNQE